MLEKLKTLLGISEEPPSLVILLGMIENQVRKITRRPPGETLPEDLQDAIVQICFARYRVQHYGTDDVPQVVTSVSDNGQSVGYKTLVSEATGRGSSDLSPEEMRSLQYWRRLF